MKEGKDNNSEKYSGFKEARNRMVTSQIVSRGIKDKQVITAMQTVPREIFVPTEYSGSAYEDRPLPIGMGQTISQPYIVALMTESLELSQDMKVLDLCAAPGGKTGFLADLMNNQGELIAIDRYESRLKILNKNLERLGVKNVKSQNINR